MDSFKKILLERAESNRALQSFPASVSIMINRCPDGDFSVMFIQSLRLHFQKLKYNTVIAYKLYGWLFVEAHEDWGI